MPNKAREILERLSVKANRIAEAIERRQLALDRDVTRLERQLFTLLQAELFGLLQTDGGRIANTRENLLLLARIDFIFDQWARTFQTRVLRDYAASLIAVTALTGEMYRGQAAAQTFEAIAADNATLLAAIGVDSNGNVVQGSLIWELSQSAQVRQDVKNVVLQAIQQGQTLRQFQTTLRDYVVSTPQADGRLKRYWRTYAYDVFNKAAEVKNEQFRRGLNLQWLIYVGSVIKDSRDFCRKKAGRVFAVVEAEQEWPKDPDLIGKKTGIPYVPLIDRGRWNCRHRIRYITEETAREIDPAKVERIIEKYGSKSIQDR